MTPREALLALPHGPDMNYNTLPIHLKINVKAFASITWRRVLIKSVRGRNPYIYAGDFTHLPIKTGKGHSI